MNHNQNQNWNQYQNLDLEQNQNQNLTIQSPQNLTLISDLNSNHHTHIHNHNYDYNYHQKAILDNLNYFSNITQDTLSAFHFSGIDSELYETIEELKRALLNKKERTLKTVIYENKKYKRIFTDGHFDIVDENKLFEPSLYKQNVELLSKLNKKPTPLTSIKLGEIKCTSSPVKISNIVEELFLKQ